MNGTIYEEIKKNGDSKKKEKLKLVVTLLSTNLLVALLCLTFDGNDPLPSDPKTITKTLHPHFKMVVVPLTVLIDVDQSRLETAITLMNKSKKVLITKAYLHDPIPASKDFEGPPRFKIEIPEEDVMQISADSTEAMIAIPEIKLREKVLKTINKRVSKYEINL
jgi:hypothetical protein